MYIPKHFQVTDRTLLHGLMERFSFATLVTTHEGRPFATHLPFLVYPGVGDLGLLAGHVSRANDQWRDFADGSEALAIFQGQHAYISPSWYQVHPSVPTWNYMVVHAYGVPRVIEDGARVCEVLGALVDKHEGAFDEPWRLDGLPDDYLDKMTRGIVTFELPIARLEGKFKLSQNRSEIDQRQVVESLASSADPLERELAAAMAAAL